MTNTDRSRFRAPGKDLPVLAIFRDGLVTQKIRGRRLEAAPKQFSPPRLCASRATREAGFTLIEVLAILLVLALGLGSVVALVAVGRRQAGLAQMRLAGTQTALTALYDHAPIGRTADVSDGDGDGWSGAGNFSWTGNYTLESSGTINGFWIKRTETSTTNDIQAVNRRLAWVTVEVFWGLGGTYVTTIQEQILREGVP